jgi:hypothetical protein
VSDVDAGEQKEESGDGESRHHKDGGTHGFDSLRFRFVSVIIVSN